MRVRSLVALFGLFAVTAVQAGMIAGVDPKSASLTVLDGSEPYFSISYFAWGPEWSGVKRKAVVSGEGDTAVFSIANRIKRTDVAFSVNGKWTQRAPRTLALEAELDAEGESAIGMAQFGLEPGPAFAGGRVRVQESSGQANEYPLPVKRGSLGVAVEKLELIDGKGASTKFTFHQPVRLGADKRQIRMILARSAVGPAEKPRINIEIGLAQETEFEPDIRTVGESDSSDDWYAFKIPDRIPDDSVWQMRDWLEKPAGKHGRILRQGDKLVYNAAPIKLWGITNTYDNCAPDAALADKRADFYSALGINAVRLHKFADGPGWQGILAKGSHTEFDPAELDRMDYFVAALKKQGIYVNLSPVFIVGIGPNDRERVPYMDEFGLMKNHRIDPKHGSFYISTELQDLQIQQVVNLLNHRNPYTGLRYADDPTVAYLEMYNEDSALFGGVTSVMAKSPTLRERTGRVFANWLEARYKTEDAFMAAWGPKALNSNVVSNGKLPTNESWREKRIYPAGNPWFFDPTNLDSTQRHIKSRLLDTMLFLYETQNEVYARYQTAIRATGYSGELIASNWQAGRMMSHFYNLHSDALIGTIDRHNYFGGGKRGSVASLLTPPSMLDEPGSGILSASMQQVDGLPFMLSEWIHVDNNPYAVEGPALIGAYGFGLQGWDAAFAFQNGDDGTFSDGGHRKRWDATAPNFLGIFPAVSRQIHRGDVTEADIGHYRNVAIQSLEQSSVGFDDFIAQSGDFKAFRTSVFNSSSLAVTRGVVRYTSQQEATFKIAEHGLVPSGNFISSTGELAWRGASRFAHARVKIDSSRTKAVIGDLSGGRVEFKGLSISSISGFVAIYLTEIAKTTSMTASSHFLLSAIGGQNRVDATQDSMFLLKKILLSLEFDQATEIHVFPLDSSGRRLPRAVRQVSAGTVSLDTSTFQSPFYELKVFYK